jgi:hypothetical protein
MRTIQLRGSDINGDQSSCTVAQLIIVFRMLAEHAAVPDLVWYGGDMAPALGPLRRYSGGTVLQIGTVSRVLELLESLIFLQIDFGLFAAFPASIVPTGLDQAVSTEGPLGQKFRASQVEVVVFDDTFIEVTTDFVEILDGLKSRFPGADIAS